MENFDFIEIYNNALSETDCDLIINLFETNKELHNERNEEERSIKINDTSFNLIDIQNKDGVKDLLYRIDSCLRTNYEKYGNKYKDTTLLRNYFTKTPIFTFFKIQKTKVGKGYIPWHHEKHLGTISENRFLVFTIYLNDINDGGETEFLYQNKLIQPRKGDLCLFPAEFTHVHRGNPPLSDTKYILTGWFHKNN